MSFDEQLRRQTNQRLADELISMMAAARKLSDKGLTTSAEDTMKSVDQIAKLMKERGI